MQELKKFTGKNTKPRSYSGIRISEKQVFISMQMRRRIPYKYVQIWYDDKRGVVALKKGTKNDFQVRWGFINTTGIGSVVQKGRYYWDTREQWKDTFVFKRDKREV